MAEFRCDLTLDDGVRYTEPGTRERATLVRELMHDAGVDPTRVRFDVREEHGPAGGNPDCRVSGPKDEIDRFFVWFCDGMNGTTNEWDDDFASEYYTAADRAAPYDVTPDTCVANAYADRCGECGRAL